MAATTGSLARQLCFCSMAGVAGTPSWMPAALTAAHLRPLSAFESSYVTTPFTAAATAGCLSSVQSWASSASSKSMDLDSFR